MTTSSYGTPQARRRLLLLAVRRGSGNERLPAPGPELGPLFTAIRHGDRIPKEFREFREILEDADDIRLTTSAQALSDLPDLEAGEPELPRAYAHKALTAYQRAVRQSAPRHLSNTQTPKVRRETVQRLRRIPPGCSAQKLPSRFRDGLSRSYSSAYRRLHPEAPATSLSTKYDCAYHYTHHRALSVREYARLQGIPDFVSFPAELVCRRSAYEMIGNSVPPFLIQGVTAVAMS